MKNIWIIVAALLALGALIFFMSSSSMFVSNEPTGAGDDTPISTEPDGGIGDGAEPLEELVADEDETELPSESLLGTSADGSDIMAYHFGEGETEILFVGGIHSGFSPNTVAVVEDLKEALEDETITVPEGVRVTVIPNLNPDAPAAVNALAGRLNGNGVDLNRNFDCEWQATGKWQNKDVSGGSAAFSEPETAAIRDYVEAHDITAAVVYYASAGGVYSSTCRNGILPDTTALTEHYAAASGYGAYKEFDYYEITGDMVNWMAGEGIAGISVLLSDHQTPEWSKNKAGIEAVLNYYAN